MASLEHYLDERVAHGRSYFVGDEARSALGVSQRNFAAAVTRLINKGRLANPRHGFFLILRPEDRVAGAPDPVRWIDPLMKHQGLAYRVSLLRAAAFHGSSHQAAMVFQIIAPKQLRDFEIGRHRLQFLYQAPQIFSHVNLAARLGQMKSDEGFAKVAGVELTLLDCARYFHDVGGINGVAQIAKDIGGEANSHVLADAAEDYENSSVRRLGYLLDLANHSRQAKVLEPFVKKAKTVVPLNPAVTSLVASLAEPREKNSRWKLMINESVEVEA
ncbi:MAG TPA: type IV toxin-antitoxin system AbiEi family antitoxin [Steroidobacteraceae bacterium]|nr:type IV toxin-antitoxin system AbiEi family antitoxin [Steroidobacteraceae bacterium]